MCCTECAYPGAPGECVEAHCCPCHEPASPTPPPTAERIALAASRYDGEDDQAAKLTDAALRRLEWRKRNAGKECARCHETKPVSDYGPDAGRPDGLAAKCRACDADRKRAARRRNV